MLWSLFLPFADQDRPPLNPGELCAEIEKALDALRPDTERSSAGEQLGIRVYSDQVATQQELWEAVEPVLPSGDPAPSRKFSYLRR